MTSGIDDPYLKYALFCRGTQEGDDGELNLNGIVDLVDLPEPSPGGEAGLVVAEVDVNLAFCIGGALPGEHHLFVTLKTPAFRWRRLRPSGCSGTKAYCSSGGSRPSASRCRLPVSIPPPSSSTASPWARPASWCASSRQVESEWSAR